MSRFWKRIPMTLRGSRMWRIYYHEIKFLVEQCDSRRRLLWHQCLNVLFAAWLLRLLAIWISVALRWDHAVFQVDTLAGLIRRLLRNDGYVVLSFASLFVFALLHNSFILHTSHSYIWQLVYELVVRNTDDFSVQNRFHRQRNIERRQKKIANQQRRGSIDSVHRSFVALRRAKQDLGHLWQFNRYLEGDMVNFRYSIRYFPFISTRTRVRLFILLTLGELMISVVFVVFGLMSIAISMTISGHFFGLSSSHILAALTIADILFLAYLGWSLFKLCSLAFMSHMMLLYVFKCAYTELGLQLEQSLTELIPRRTAPNRTKSTQLKSIHNLHHLRREHARITQYIFDADQQFWSTGSFIMFFTNIPINVYFVTYLHYRSVEVSVSAVMLAILCLQTCPIIVTLLITADVSTAAHSSKRFLAPIQHNLPRKWISLKLKCDQFLEQLMAKRKIAFSVASLGAITKESIVQSVIIYMSYYIYAARLINSSKMYSE